MMFSLNETSIFILFETIFWKLLFVYMIFDVKQFFCIMFYIGIKEFFFNFKNIKLKFNFRIFVCFNHGDKKSNSLSLIVWNNIYLNNFQKGNSVFVIKEAFSLPLVFVFERTLFDGDFYSYCTLNF